VLIPVTRQGFFNIGRLVPFKTPAFFSFIANPQGNPCGFWRFCNMSAGVAIKIK
jgi:hypothetical protein